MIYSKPFNGDYAVTSGYGSRKDPFTGKDSHHNGIDFGLPVNTPLFNLEAGVVLYAGVIDYFNPKSGNLAVGVKADSDEVVAVYMHMNRIDVKVGQRVGIAQQIGLSGNTGYSTAPHLHFGLYPRLASGSWNETIDPSFLLNTWKNPNDIINPQNPLDMKYSEELAKLKNRPKVWNAPTMHNQNKYIFESGLPIAIAEELISKDVWANNTIANKDKQIADLKAELTQKPTVVEVENPVNDELQNKIDFLNRQNLAMAETVKIFKTEIDELRGQLDKFTTTQSFEPIMVTDPKTKEDLTKLEAGAGLAKKPTVGESPKVEIKQEPFKIRSESLKASLGVVKNVIPSVGTFLLAVGVTQDSTTQIVSFVTAGVSFLTAIYLEWDKTQYNAKEAEKKKI
jgi:hypothetical protein